MCDSTIPVICFYNGKNEMTETYMKYVGNKIVIVPLNVLIDCTYDQFLTMIYSRTCIDKEIFKLVLKDKTLKNLVCRAALATEVGKFNKYMETIGRINLEGQR